MFARFLTASKKNSNRVRLRGGAWFLRFLLSGSVAMSKVPSTLATIQERS